MNQTGPSSDNPIMQAEDDGGGSKIALHGHHGLWKKLEKAGINTELLWRNICMVVLKSLPPSLTHSIAYLLTYLLTYSLRLC